MSIFTRHKSELPTADQALPGRTERPFHLAERHRVLDAPLVTDEAPEGYEVAIFGLGTAPGMSRSSTPTACTALSVASPST